MGQGVVVTGRVGMRELGDAGDGGGTGREVEVRLGWWWFGLVMTK